MGIFKSLAKQIHQNVPMARSENFTSEDDNDGLLALSFFGILLWVCMVILFIFTIGAFLWNEGAVPLNSNLKSVTYKGGQLRLLAFAMLGSWFFY